MFKRKVLGQGGGLLVALFLGVVAQQALAAEPAPATNVETPVAVQVKVKTQLANYLKAVDAEVDYRLQDKLEAIEPHQVAPIYLANAKTRIRV